MSSSCLLNGAPAAGVGVRNRGLAYGDGLFETLAVFAGQPRFWQAHMDRLAAGCERLGFPMPAQETLLRDLHEVARDRDRCVVKIVLTRGAGGRGYRPAPDAGVERLVSRHEFPGGIETLSRSGVTARTLEFRLAAQPALGGIKHLNRLEQVLAARELSQHPEDEGILIDYDGYLVSAVSANLFLVDGERLLTPRLDRCGVRGVVRNLLVRDFKPRCELRRLTPDMLAEAGEVFICNAVRGVIPVTTIDEQDWPVGPVTRELQAWFRERADTP